MRLTLRNIGDEAMPAGLGFHPYFQADEDSSLQFQADRLWLAAADLLPVREVAADALGDWSAGAPVRGDGLIDRSEEHTSELQSLMRISYAVFCLKKKKENI